MAGAPASTTTARCGCRIVAWSGSTCSIGCAARRAAADDAGGGRRRRRRRVGEGQTSGYKFGVPYHVYRERVAGIRERFPPHRRSHVPPYGGPRHHEGEDGRGILKGSRASLTRLRVRRRPRTRRRCVEGPVRRALPGGAAAEPAELVHAPGDAPVPPPDPGCSQWPRGWPCGRTCGPCACRPSAGAPRFHTL